LEDEGVEAPALEAIRLALNAVDTLRESGVDAPSRTVPDGDGGVVFRWRSGDNAWTLAFEADGTIESSLVAKGRLVSRHALLGVSGV